MERMKRVLAVVLGATCAGCLSEVRTSSAQYVNEPSAFRFAGSADEAARWLTAAFAKRGFPLTNSYAVSEGRAYVFEGSRPAGVRRGAVPSDGYLAPLPFVLGSVYYAVVTDTSGTTKVTMLGKPTFDGNPVCSDADAAWRIPCTPYSAAPNWIGRSEVSGAQEAEAIRGVIVEAAVAEGVTPESIVETASPPVFAETPAKPVSNAPPACNPEDDPAWGRASAAEKKQLYEACAGTRAPATP
jgi:hypothetical protein